MSPSSVSTTASRSFSRYSAARSAISSGIGPGSPSFAALGARVRAHVEHVDDAGQLVLGADRDVHGHALRREPVAQRLERAEEVGALAVEHVHEHDAREPELVGEPPRARRPDLDAHDGRDRHERALDDPRRAAELALERRIAGDVDEVHLAVLPRRVLERHGDRELPLVLVLVRVGDGRARLDGPEAVDRARLEEKRLDERRLSRPAVADDGDVADLCGLGHGLALLLGVRFPAEKLSRAPERSDERSSASEVLCRLARIPVQRWTTADATSWGDVATSRPGEEAIVNVSIDTRNCALDDP